MITFKGRHTPKPIILQGVRWYCSYALSYRNIEGNRVDSDVEKWQQRYSSQSHVTPVEQFYALAA